MNKIFIVCIIILVALIIFQVCQFETYEDYVVENFTNSTCRKENITIGASESTDKIVDLSEGNWQSVSHIPVNPQNPYWNDTFSIELLENNQLKVSRTDVGHGWGQNLILEGLVCNTGCTIEEILVGGSGTNPKIIVLPENNWLSIDPTPINEQDTNWNDEFSVELMDNNNLKVTRIDSNSGWGQNLILSGITCDPDTLNNNNNEVNNYNMNNNNNNVIDDNGCTETNLVIGSNRTNQKVVALPHGNWISINPTPVNSGTQRWTSKFNVELISKNGINNKARITRTDIDSGWGQNLTLRGRVCPIDDTILCIDTNIVVGSSEENNKIISLPAGNWTRVNSVPLNLQESSTSVTFETELLDLNRLKITRTDTDSGWEQNLILSGLVCPNMIEGITCSIKNITVGPSPTSGIKIIELPGTYQWSYINSTPLNVQSASNTSKFNTEILPNNRLKITKINGSRLDRWSENLILSGLACQSESPLTDAENLRMEMVNNINDKLTIVNDKMNRFDNMKPVRSSAYRKLFENDFPEYMEKERGSAKMNRQVFNVSQQTQNYNLNKMEDEVDKLTAYFNKELSLSDKKEVKSITSHNSGMNLNLIKRDDHYSIPVNNGCLFVVDNESGTVDYDVSSIDRTDKNKICIANNPEQHFKLSKIDGLDGYQKLTGSPVIDRPMDNESVEYPFYVLKPRKYEKMCLQSDNDGVTIQPCNFNKKQRWGGNEFTKPCDCA
jgi:hypothetical protein